MMSSDTAEERWINSQSHIFYDAQGEPLRMIGVNIDITERKRINGRYRNRRSGSGSRSMKRPLGWHWLRSMGVSSVSIVRSARSSATVPPS